MKTKLCFESIFSIVLFALTVLFSSCEKDFTKQSSATADEEDNAKAATKPNIILILGDDIGYEVPGYTGGQSYATPNINAMAAAGIQFTACYGTPMCSPSRFELLTGKYNNRNYYEDSWGHMDLSQKTIANLMKKAGYQTCIAGKWQLDGGDESIRNFGFDKYSVTNAFRAASAGGNGDDDEGLDLYKNPSIYQNGAYLPKASMIGKYGEDVNRNYMFSFMDSAAKQGKPFFAMWTPNLCHQPFSPTPDDPEFAAWDPSTPKNDGDTMWFPSMIKYFDKEIGLLMNKVKTSAFNKNTVVIFIIGDNGTDGRIVSRFKGSNYRGGKGKTNRGTHVPMIVYAPFKVQNGAVNNNLIDFTDILPTISDMTGTSIPANFGIIDGQSFYKHLLGVPSTPRTSLFCYYNVNRWGPDTIPPIIWTMDYKYKLYEDTSTRFYNYISDSNEKNMIPENKMNAEQKKSDSTLDAVIKYYMQ